MIFSLDPISEECEVIALDTPTATDNCSGALSGTPDKSLPITNSTIITWTFDDGNGNTSTQTQEVIINPIDNAVAQIDEVTLMATAAGYNYQWVDCNNENAPIVDETNQTFVAATSGSYAVIIDNGTCNVISACTPVGMVGVEENSFAQTLSIYPNPTFGQLRIDLDQVYAHVKVSAYNSLGQLSKKEVFDFSDSIDFSIGGAAGVYFIIIQVDDNKEAVMKLVKM